MEERYGIFTQRIARISRCIRRLKAEEMARFGLKGPHVSCLYYLGLDGPLTAAELSERCDEDKAAVSRTLEFLLQNGYVTTEAVSRRYRSPLYLTDRGREVFAALQARIASMEDAASMGLTEEQRSKMYAALELICAIWSGCAPQNRRIPYETRPHSWSTRPSTAGALPRTGARCSADGAFRRRRAY